MKDKCDEKYDQKTYEARTWEGFFSKKQIRKPVGFSCSCYSATILSRPLWYFPSPSPLLSFAFSLSLPPQISFFLPAPLFFPCFVSSSASHVCIPSHLPPESSPLQSPLLPQKNSSPIMSSSSRKKKVGKIKKINNNNNNNKNCLPPGGLHNPFETFLSFFNPFKNIIFQSFLTHFYHLCYCYFIFQKD